MKTCSKCGIWKPRSEFYKNPKASDNLRSWCKLCCNKDNRKREPKYKKTREKYLKPEHGKKQAKLYRQTHKKELSNKKKQHYQKHRNELLELKKQYYKTILGHLRRVYNNIKHRCNNSEAEDYKWYGGRGIKVKFKSSNEFINYVRNELKVDPRNLDIDRINNNGHYEPGNIRFITHRENCNNRRN